MQSDYSVLPFKQTPSVGEQRKKEHAGMGHEGLQLYL